MRETLRAAACFLLIGGCSVDLSVPEGAEITCVKNTDCPVGMQCSGLKQCVDIGANQPPQVVLGSPNPQGGGRWLATVHVPLSVSDPNAAPVGRDSVAVAFSWGIPDATTAEVADWQPTTAHSSSGPLSELGGANPAQGS